MLMGAAILNESASGAGMMVCDFEGNMIFRGCKPLRGGGSRTIEVEAIRWSLLLALERGWQANFEAHEAAPEVLIQSIGLCVSYPTTRDNVRRLPFDPDQNQAVESGVRNFARTAARSGIQDHLSGGKLRRRQRRIFTLEAQNHQQIQMARCSICDDGMLVEAVVAVCAAAAACLCAAHHLIEEDRAPAQNHYLTRRGFLDEVIRSEDNCYNLLRMNMDAFQRLVIMLRGSGRLHDTFHCSVDEQLAMGVMPNDPILDLVDSELQTTQHMAHPDIVEPILSRAAEGREGTRIRALIMNEMTYNGTIFLAMDTFSNPHEHGNSDNTRTRKNTIWSPEMDKCLVESLVIQANEGLKIDKGFKEHAYTVTRNIINCRFVLDLANHHIINRMKTIRKKYRVIKDMLSASGFAWNEISKTIECDDDAHPDAKGMRGKPIEMLDELSIVCGVDQATGQWARIPSDVNARRQMETQEPSDGSFPMMQPGFDDYTEGDGVDSFPYMGRTSSRPVESNTTGSSHHSGKRTKRSKNIEAVNETMGVVAHTMGRLAEAIERIHNVVNDEALVQKVEELEGVDEATRVIALEFLNDNPSKAKTFMQLSSNERRSFFIFRHLSDYGVRRLPPKTGFSLQEHVFSQTIRLCIHSCVYEELPLIGNCLDDHGASGSSQPLWLYNYHVLNGLRTNEVGKFDDPIMIPVYQFQLCCYKKYWGEDANKFNPLRFANGISKATKHPNKCSSTRFFHGFKHVCIGQNLQCWKQLKMVVAVILQRCSLTHSPILERPFHATDSCASSVNLGS
ncbi:hypothetical protein HHK36_029165 [Tetracentron sinense]|uniref:Myb/SANT-like domain-containing protein n=1 Tax=Tetracentron sinense TaxID=13715 RepID=A0A834YHH3_TETSI|nr:hypothetical protein HHK36_029165 [Tetracentron sinense]